MKFVSKGTLALIDRRRLQKTYDSIDESHGVTLGLSRIFKYIISILQRCEAASHRAGSSAILQRSILQEYDQICRKTRIYRRDCFTDHVFVFDLSHADSRIPWLDMDNTVLNITFRLYDSADSFNENSDGGEMSSSYKYVKQDEGYICADFTIRFDVLPEEDGSYTNYVAQYKLSDMNCILPLLQHEFNHVHKKVEMNVNRKYADAYNLIYGVKQTYFNTPGCIYEKIADCLYRYCFPDEVNAYVEQGFREYQRYGRIEQTEVWRQADYYEDFFSNVYIPGNVRQCAEIYKNFHGLGEILFGMRDAYGVKDDDRKHLLFTRALIRKILQKIAEFKRKLRRTTKVPLNENDTFIRKSWRFML